MPTKPKKEAVPAAVLEKRNADDAAKRKPKAPAKRVVPKKVVEEVKPLFNGRMSFFNEPKKNRNEKKST